MHILSQNDPSCRGRFAPSPTGPLHFGSLVAAVASYVDAKAAGGEWLLRIEDLDTRRNVPGAAEAFVRGLEALGFAWDGTVLYQSTRLAHYHEALEALRARGVLFGCACTRREIADSALRVDGARRYPGTCRGGLPPGRSARAFRLRVEEGEIGFDDRILGRLSQDVAQAVGDFVLLRADGQIAYQLAVVVDDAAQGVTDVVRGADLLDSTARQIYLQRLLGLPAPRYMHVPVAVNAAGEKLSKQTLATPVDVTQPQAALCAALRFLGHAPPADVCRDSVAALWQWVFANWDPARIAPARYLPAPRKLA